MTTQKLIKTLTIALILSTCTLISLYQVALIGAFGLIALIGGIILSIFCYEKSEFKIQHFILTVLGIITLWISPAIPLVISTALSTTNITYLIPENYQGTIQIIEDKNSPPAIQNNKNIIININENGKSYLQSLSTLKKTHTRKYFYKTSNIEIDHQKISHQTFHHGKNRAYTFKVMN